MRRVSLLALSAVALMGAAAAGAPWWLLVLLALPTFVAIAWDLRHG